MRDSNSLDHASPLRHRDWAWNDRRSRLDRCRLLDRHPDIVAAGSTRWLRHSTMRARRNAGTNRLRRTPWSNSNRPDAPC
jgi:hypothetical protein